MYNIDSLIKVERESYLFYKSQGLLDFVSSSLEELKKLEKGKFELTKRTVDFSYSGPVEGSRAIFRQNAYGILEVVKARTYSETTFGLLENLR